MAWQQPGNGEWETCHFVLTRSCFLHWFRSSDALDTLDGIRLARCQVMPHSRLCRLVFYWNGHA